MKTWKYVTTWRDVGKTLDTLLREAGFSKKEISRQKFLQDGITVDGERCRITKILKEGQQVLLQFKKEETNYGKLEAEKLPVILYEDKDILILNKPSGCSTHPCRGHYMDNIGVQASAYCRMQGEEERIRPVGRLDKDTSGIVIFAKSRIAAARLHKQREKGILKKTYIALVYGEMEKQEGVIHTPLKPVSGEKNRMCIAGEQEKGALTAVTHYRVLKILKKERMSLVECILDTGRTHQIRVHMASKGHPIVGDEFYGKEGETCKRLCLHAGKLELCQPFTGKNINITGECLPGQEFPVMIQKFY